MVAFGVSPGGALFGGYHLVGLGGMGGLEGDGWLAFLMSLT